MPAIRSLTDLLTVTLENMPRNEFEETLTRRDVPLARLLFQDARKGKSGGFAMKNRIRVRASTSARAVNPYEGQGALQQNYMVAVATDWITFIDNMLFNEIEDDLNSGNENQLVDLMKVRRSATHEGLFNLFESQSARAPINAADTKSIWGFDYWFRRISTTGTPDTEGGFNGLTVRFQDATTQTTLGAGSGAPDANDPLNANLRNWDASYSGVLDITAFRTLRKARRRTQFRTAADLKGILDRGGRQLLLMPEDQAEQYEDLANAGPDFNDGDVTKQSKYKLDGLDMIPVPEFNGLAYLPIYGLKMGQIEGDVLNGRWMKELKAIQDPNDAFTYKIPVTCTCNMRVLNPRNAGFVVSYVAGS